MPGISGDAIPAAEQAFRKARRSRVMRDRPFPMRKPLRKTIADIAAIAEVTFTAIPELW